MESLRVEANRQVSKLVIRGVPDRPGIAAEIFGIVGTKGFNVELVVTTGGTRGEAEICLAVSSGEDEAVRTTLDALRDELQASSIELDKDVALISVIGSNLSKVPGVAGRMFKALSARGVNIDVISTSLSSVTCMIPEDRTEPAIAALEGEFLDDRRES
ncbi:MAG: ACT domain-containing protein [Candidatus Eisenbacteria bacterium]|nr:ACT domain-containing protein [Candidatus Eisenbacteria bacterium]